MSIKAAICTQCGAKIEVDDTKEAGICQFCGTAFITEKVINKYLINVSNATINIANANTDNLMKMAQNAFDAGNYSESIEYYKKVLEIDPENGKALFERGRCSYLVSVSNPNTIDHNELFVYTKKALSNTKDNEFINYVLHKLNDLSIITAVTAKNYYNSGDNWKIQNNCLILIKGLTAAHIITDYIITYIEDNDLQKKEEYSELYKVCLENDLMYLHDACEEHEYVNGIIGGPYVSSESKGKIKIDNENHSKLIKVYDNVLEKYIAINGNSDNIPDINRTIEMSGCYIATCVYGSYDCPEVWVLRRYRDFSLSKTIAGKAFIKIYYMLSPKIVKKLGDKDWFKNIFKYFLDKKINRLKRKGYENTPYNDLDWK